MVLQYVAWPRSAAAGGGAVSPRAYSISGMRGCVRAFSSRQRALDAEQSKGLRVLLMRKGQPPPFDASRCICLMPFYVGIKTHSLHVLSGHLFNPKSFDIHEDALMYIHAPKTLRFLSFAALSACFLESKMNISLQFFSPFHYMSSATEVKVPGNCFQHQQD